MVRKIISAVSQILRWCFLILISIYQKCISPMLGQHCRFYPSCSQYAQNAISMHTLPKAFYLILRRLLRCHPFHSGGFDPASPRE